MPTFSEMFPTYARLISSIGRLVPRRGSRERFAPPYQVSSAPSYANRQEDHYSNPDSQPEESFEELLSSAGQPPEEEDVQPVGPTGEVTEAEATADSPARPSQPDLSPNQVLQDTRPAVASGSSAPALSPQENEILRLYQSWVELESDVADAREHLTQILANRGKAVVFRREAQEILEQGDQLREESQRIGDAAWRAFDRGFATDIRGFASRRAMVREIDLSRRTQAELRRNVHRKAWESVEQSREDATKELIKLLDSLGSVAGLVQRELDEATTLPGLARSLRESAEEELRCAEAVKDELLLLGTEALNQLGITPTSETPYSLEPEANPIGAPGARDLNPPRQAASEALPRSSGDGTESGEEDQGVPGSLSWEATAQSLELSPDISDSMTQAGTPTPGSRLDEPPSAAGPASDQPQTQSTPEPPEPVAQPPAAQPEILASERPAAGQPPIEPQAETQPAAVVDLLREMEAARASVEDTYAVPPVSPPQITDQPPPETQTPRTVDAEVIRPAGPASGPVSEPQGAETSPGPLPAAEQLLRDMEAARSTIEQPQTPAPSAAEELARELEALRQATAPQGPGAADSIPPDPMPPQAAPTPSAPLDQVSEELPRVVEAAPVQTEPAPAPTPPAPAPMGNPAAPTYSGLLNLMFPPTLTQDEMGIVWEVLEEVSKGGQILDSRLISASEGIQFTVQLGPMGIMVEDLTTRLFGAQVWELEADRLKVDWPQTR